MFWSGMRRSSAFIFEFTSIAGFLLLPLLISKIARVLVVLSMTMPICAIAAVASSVSSFCRRNPGARGFSTNSQAQTPSTCGAMALPRTMGAIPVLTI